MEKTNNTSDNYLHWIIGSTLIIIGIMSIIGLVTIKSRTTGEANINADATINNANPAVDDSYITTVSNSTQATDGSAITLTAGSTKSVWITGTVSDTNGYEDIATVEGVFYEDGTVTNSCTLDNNNCYKDSNCALTNCSGNTCDFHCDLTVQYWADATDTGGRNASSIWKGNITVIDDSSGTGNNAGSLPELEIGTLLSATFGTTISFPALSLSESTTSENDVQLVMTQAGNDQVDARFKATSSDALTCTVGIIPAGNIEWSNVSVDYGSGTDLTTSFADTDNHLNYRDNEDNPITVKIYWGIGIPSSGVSGTCSGVINADVVAQ